MCYSSATDSGDSTSGVATITITVTDVNEFDPVFTKPTSSSETINVADGLAAQGDSFIFFFVLF